MPTYPFTTQPSPGQLDTCVLEKVLERKLQREQYLGVYGSLKVRAESVPREQGSIHTPMPMRRAWPSISLPFSVLCIFPQDLCFSESSLHI